MPEISINNIKMPTLTALNQTGMLGMGDGTNSLFGDDIIGGTEDSYTSDAMKSQIKAKAQELVRKTKNLKTRDADGNEKTNPNVRKSLDKQMKMLKEQAEAAGIDLNEIFSEIAEESKMTRKQRKELQKNLKVSIKKKSDTTSSSTVSDSSQNKVNPFGFGKLSGMGMNPIGNTGSITPTTNPSYGNSPSVKLDQNFLNKTKEISQRIGCDYKDLLAVMNSESGLKSNAKNPKGSATGLIQFMPATAKMLGTTTDELRKMSPTQQLDYVEKFFVQVKKTYGFEGKKLSGADLYALVFMPARANRDILTSASDGKTYSMNKGLDKDGDGHISKADLQRRVASCYVDESKVFGTA